MAKIFQTLFSLALLIIASNALYKHQAGKYDWEFRTIGDIDRVRFLSHKTAFITKDGFIGVAQTSNGKIDWSKDLSTHQSYTELGQNGFIVLDSKSKTLFTFDYLNGLKLSSTKLIEVPIQEEIINAYIEGSETSRSVVVGILTAENVYLFKDQALEYKQKNSDHFKYLKFSKENDIIYGITDNNKEVCIHNLEIRSQPKNSKKCVTTGSGNQVRVYKDQVVINGPSQIKIIPFTLGNQVITHNFTSQGDHTYLEKCSALISQKDQHAKIFTLDVRSSSFVQVGSIDAPMLSNSFSCNEETLGDKFLVFTELSGASTLKIKRINLSTPTEIPKILLDKVAPFSIGKIQEVYSSRLGDDFRVLLKTENLQNIMITRENNIAWKHEDSLSEIKEIQFFDYESLGEREINPYFDHLDENNDRLVDLPTNLIRRVKAQIAKLVQGINSLLKLASTSINLEKIWETDAKFDKHNGLQKIIIAITNRNTIFGIDSKTGDIFWEKVIDNNWQIERIYKSKRNHLAKEALVYLKDSSSKQSKFLHIDPLNGFTSHEEKLNKIPQELIQLHLAKSTAFVIVFDDQNVELYPKILDQKEVAEHLKDFSIYRISKKSITGYHLLERTLLPTWNFQLQEKEEVLKSSHWSYDAEETAVKTIIPEDRKVIYKFSDSNNFALLTKSTFDRPHINLYIINGATGRVLNSRLQYDVDFTQPINLLYDENTIFVSYFNTKSLQSEIWVTELYKSELESSFTYLLERYFFEKLQTDEEAKYNNANPGFVVFTQKYYFPPGIKSFGAIETVHGIARKNLVIVTSNDQIYSLDRGLLSTRRQISLDGKPLESDPTSFGSSELPPYTPMLPILNQKYLTYYKRYAGLNHVEASPTRFESTSLCLIYGHDVVYARAAPEKEFDMLSGDFKFELLVGSMALIFIALIVVKRLTRKHKLNKIFLS